MNKELLYKFFEGTASMEEGMKIKAWMEESTENEQAFYKERKLFDAILLNGNQRTATQRNFFPILKKLTTTQWVRMAGIVIVTLLTNYFFQQYKENHAPVSMNIITVPAGQRANITLPDGTNVWLNARTTLQYPSSFNRRQRTVALNGEAYFDVSKNKKKPFVVQTKNYNIEVLGTKFNVNAYDGQNEFETALMQGSVKVNSHSEPNKTVTLVPTQRVYLKDGKLKTGVIEETDAYRWTEGLMCFKKTPFRQIINSFEKYYGVKIVIKNQDVLKYSFTGKFRQSEGLDYALRVLQKSIDFKYDKDNDQEIIYIR